jgi:alanine racemase
MTLRLYVDRDRWEANARAVADAYEDVIAVVKGNGYGFGLGRLAVAACALGFRHLAVGTVHELAPLPPLEEPPLVLTPVVDAAEVVGHAVLTVGSVAHVEIAARGGTTPVAVKLASSMHRYGVAPSELGGVLAASERAGLDVRQFALHLPLVGTVDEADEWLARLPGDIPLTVSHLEPGAVAGLRVRHPGRRIAVRLGTALWHGDRSFLALRAEVVDTRAVRAGARAGYRRAEVFADGTLVMVGAGTAHGVHPLPDGRSPFHFARRRLALIEPPHMHTAMAFVPAGEPFPAVGDEVDVQQPLTFVRVDRVVER